MSHTKGTWDYNENLLKSDGIVEIFGPHDEGGLYPIADVLKGNRSFEETLANAKFIVGAVDLYRWVKCFLEDYYKSQSRSDQKVAAEAGIFNMVDAIKKMEGGK